MKFATGPICEDCRQGLDNDTDSKLFVVRHKKKTYCLRCAVEIKNKMCKEDRLYVFGGRRRKPLKTEASK